MRTILITGANRGLGFEFTRQYLEAGQRVIATCRQPAKAVALRELESRYGELLSIISLDVSNENDIIKAADVLGGQIDVIDTLINNAGVGRWEDIEDTTLDLMTSVYRTNAAAPLIVTRAFLPMLKKSQRPLVANITSFLGSTSKQEELGVAGSFCYNASKAALNMIGKMLSIQLKGDGIIVLLQSPGWASTDMGGEEAPNSPVEVVAGMIKIFENASLGNSGKFYQWTGEELPW